ncbi:diguanylate cyclase [bacterium]|nr:diguanylate cyclase [bacterium]
MPGITTSISALAETSVANGYAMALALVVLLQYVHSVTRRKSTIHTAAKFRREVDDLSIEVLQLSRERGLQRLENQILREVLLLGDCQKAIGHLLRRFIVNPDDAFGLFMPLDPASDMPRQSRGLSEDSIKNLVLNHQTLQKLREENAIVWPSPNMVNCPIFPMLSPVDRRKARHLFLVGIGDDQGLLGILVATSLLPIAGLHTEQIELTTRLMSSIAPSLRQTLEMERQSVQLRCTREMLELRSISDGKFVQPTLMLDKFLSRLSQMVDAERTALYIASGEGVAELTLSLRTGVQLQAGVAQRWHQHEDVLSRVGCQLDQVTIWDTSQLCRQGIDTLIGSAIVLPLNDGNKQYGVAVLTRRNPAGYSASQRQLLMWASETLCHSLERALNYVAIEKEAKLDGLTGLANRRTFDSQLNGAISDLRDGISQECSLLLLDLDRFKSVNDVYGHQVGDAVIKDVAAKIRDQVERMRSQDRGLPARYGGEEMALLLPGMGINGASRIAESLRASIERHTVKYLETTLQVTVSIGVAACPIHATTGESLVQAADEALYRAKANGRNQVQCASANLA